MKNDRPTRAPAHKKSQDRNLMGKFPKSESEWISVANNMISWGRLDTSFAIEDFPLSCGYSPHKFYKWVKHNEYFADALEYTRYMVGSRREKAARERKIDSAIILKTMPLYNYEYKELVLEKINKHQESRQTQIHVIMEPIQNSEIVPTKNIQE